MVEVVDRVAVPEAIQMELAAAWRDGRAGGLAGRRYGVERDNQVTVSQVP